MQTLLQRMIACALNSECEYEHRFGHSARCILSPPGETGSALAAVSRIVRGGCRTVAHVENWRRAGLLAGQAGRAYAGGDIRRTREASTSLGGDVLWHR